MTMIRKTLLAACAALALIVPQGPTMAEEPTERSFTHQAQVAFRAMGVLLGYKARCGDWKADEYLRTKKEVAARLMVEYLEPSPLAMQTVLYDMATGAELVLTLRCGEETEQNVEALAAEETARLQAYMGD